MNFLEFFLKKNKKESNQKIYNDQNQAKQKNMRLNTQTLEFLITKNKKLQNLKTQICYKKENQNHNEVSFKYRINKQIIVNKVIKSITDYFIRQNQILQTYSKNKKISNKQQIQTISLHFYLLKSNFFRYQHLNHQQTLINYKQIIKAAINLSLKITETKNILNSQGIIYVRNQSQFCQFFKHLFGKPLKQFNQKYIRKILQQIWYYVYFQQYSTTRLIQTIKLWIYGLMIPQIPTRKFIHNAILNQNNNLIEKACQFKLYSPIYCNINQADCLGVTPIMLAIYQKKQSLLSSLFLLGADPFLIPITTFQNSELVYQQIQREILQNSYFKNQNIFISRFQTCQRQQKNLIQYLKDKNDMKLLAHLLTMQQTTQNYSLLKKKQLLEEIQQIPDCSFQILWKSQSKFPLSGDLPNDIITVYKKKSNLRIDFNIIDICQKKSFQKGKFSLLFKGKPEIQLYWIDNSNKKIINLINKPSIKQIEQRCQKFLKQGDIQHETISNYISKQTIGNNNRKNIVYQIQFDYFNCKKLNLNDKVFNTIDQYQKNILNKNIIDWDCLCKSSIQYIKEEKLNNVIKIKSNKKITKIKFQIQYFQKLNLNLNHLNSILKIVKNYNRNVTRLEKFIDIQKSLSQMGKKNQFMLFPQKCRFQMSLGISLSFVFQNFNFNNLKNQIFQLKNKLEYQNSFLYQKQQNLFPHKIIQSLNQSFSISFTKFFKSGQQNQQQQDKQAFKKYNMLLNQTNQNDFSNIISNIQSRKISKKSDDQDDKQNVNLLLHELESSKLKQIFEKEKLKQNRYI